MGSDTPKQYIQIAGDPIIVHTIRAIAAFTSLQGILVGVAAGDRWWPEISKNLSGLGCTVQTYEGGSERCETVMRGIEQIPDADASTWVLVHDAVRPMLRKSDIEDLVAKVDWNRDGGLLGLPVADTLKSEADGVVTKTIDRSHLWRALTPQFFPAIELKKALEMCQAQKYLITDEASAMERLGARPRLVPGHTDNLKITFPSDLEMAEQFLTRRKVSE